MDNTKKDYLMEDPDIPTQRFCCLSFIQPRDSNVVAKKEVFMASKFIKSFIEEYETAKEFSSNPNNTLTDEIKKKLDLSFQNVMETYEGYRKTHFTQLSNDFDSEYNPKEALTVSGVKVRGSYRNLEEAQERAQQMREYEPAVDCFVAQVGYWLPYDPENMEDVKAQFREEQLNDIYGKRQEELEKARADFETRRNELIEKNNQEQEEKKKLNARETMENMTNNESHQERKENDVVIVDEVKEEKPKKRGRPKGPTKARKAGGRRT